MSTLPPTASGAARASVEIWRVFAGTIPGAAVTERRGAAAITTGIPSATENGVWTTRRDVSPRVVEDLLDAVAATGMPHCLQLRGGTADRAVDVARRRGMTLDVEEPVMILRDPTALEGAADAPDVAIRVLAPGEGALHGRVALEVFGGSAEVVDVLLNEELMSAPGVRCYVGEVSGEPVTTGVGVTLRGSTAVFSVATLPGHRGRGFGAAITARAVLDGRSSGGRWAWLQASPAAGRMYERLGFRTVETGALWVSE
jgi:GNAT superfamily N-acetyltransferase